jgi:hypothetical protein
MTIRTLRILLGSSVLALLGGCGGDSAVRPDAQLDALTASAANKVRTLAVELTTASENDAGMIFTIEGPNIVDITPASGLELVTTGRPESNGRGTIGVLVTGPLRSGVIAWLVVKGVNSGQPYDVTVSQVAAGASEGFVQRDDLGAYTLVVRR